MRERGGSYARMNRPLASGQSNYPRLAWKPGAGGVRRYRTFWLAKHLAVATPSLSSNRTNAPAGSGPERITGALVVVWVWLAVYLAAFFFPPVSGEGAAIRPGYLLASLVRPDDFVRQWIAGCTWQGLVERGVIVAAASAILCVALAAGWTCLRLLRVDRAVTRLEMLVFSTGVGLSLVSLATLALGLAGWLNRGAMIAAAVPALVASSWIYFRRGCALGTCAITQLPVETEHAQAWDWSSQWLWLAAPFVVAIMLSSLLPPRDFDVREYHLQAPKEFYQAGRITFLPHNIYANMPLGSEMLALAGMVTLDDWWLGALAGKALDCAVCAAGRAGTVWGRLPFCFAGRGHRRGARVHFDSLGHDGLGPWFGGRGIWLLLVYGVLCRVDLEGHTR